MLCKYDILPMFISDFWSQGVFSRSAHICYYKLILSLYIFVSFETFYLVIVFSMLKV